jgi:DNA-binding LacI/PurR family transcriptional regulator
MAAKTSQTEAPSVRRQRLLESLRDGIRRGQWSAGQALPTEGELIREHDLTRHHAWLVLDTLAQEGLISRTQGRGSIVLPQARHVRKQVITIAVQDVRDWLGAGVISGVQEALADQPFRVELEDVGDTQAEFDACMERLSHTASAGLVVMPLPWLRNQEWAFRLKQEGISFVCVDNYPGGIDVDTVVTDNRLGGELAAQCLLSRGFRRLCHFGYDDACAANRDRFEGFLDAARQAAPGEVEFCLPLRYPIDEKAEREHRYPWRAAMRAWRSLTDSWEAARFPVGVFAISDIEAYGISLACKEQGLVVGRDVGLVGFDDRDLAIFADPHLSTIRQNPVAIGREAGRLLLARLANPETPSSFIKLKPELIERQSAGERECSAVDTFAASAVATV